MYPTVKVARILRRLRDSPKRRRTQDIPRTPNLTLCTFGGIRAGQTLKPSDHSAGTVRCFFLIDPPKIHSH